MTPSTIADAWAVEMTERHVNRAIPGYNDAENLFYSGAAAMFAMVCSHPDRRELLAFLKATSAELAQYLELTDDQD